jgi:hypothetical protein
LRKSLHPYDLVFGHQKALNFPTDMLHSMQSPSLPSLLPHY